MTVIYNSFTNITKNSGVYPLQDFLVLIILFIVALFIALALYYYYLHLDQVFDADHFVIKLRNGKVISTFQGGSTKCFPLIDDIVLIPTQTQLTDVKIVNQADEQEKCFDLKAIVSWNVKDPIDAFSKLSWNPEESNYAETIIKNMTESKLKLLSEDRTIDYVYSNETMIVNEISAELKNFFTSCSITISSVNLTDIDRLQHV